MWSTMTRISAWMKRVLRLVVVGTLQQDVTFVNSSVDLWEYFVESSSVQQLVLEEEATLPAEQWQQQLNIAFRLCHDMEREDMLDMNKVYPILCRLIIGTYSAEQSLSQLPHETSFLLHALVGIASSHYCPDSFFHWILKTHPEQLCIKGPVDGQLPLAIACSQRSAHIMTILHAHPDAVSIPDSKGRYPLHLACQTAYFTWESGIQDLFYAAPYVLLFPTANGTCLFLSMALALAESRAKHFPSVELSHTNTLFQLLRADPTVLQTYLP